MKTKLKEVPYYNTKKSPISYCFLEDIEKVHGAEFMKKFLEEMRGSTCPVIDEKEKPKKYRKNNKFDACYPWDYERFRNVILHNIPTYFD